LREYWFQSLLLQVSFKTAPSLKNYLAASSFNPFSFRSPSKRCWTHCITPDEWFQSLLLQVSFKTKAHGGILRVDSFNPFSFRSPSKRLGRVDVVSPDTVSIPSPSGLLQNVERRKK